MKIKGVSIFLKAVLVVLAGAISLSVFRTSAMEDENFIAKSLKESTTTTTTGERSPEALAFDLEIVEDCL